MGVLSLSVGYLHQLGPKGQIKGTWDRDQGPYLEGGVKETYDVNVRTEVTGGDGRRMMEGRREEGGRRSRSRHQQYQRR